MPVSRTPLLQRAQQRFLEQLAWARFRYNLHRQSSAGQRVIVLQSTDRAYAPLLEVSGRTNRRYAERMNYAYAQYIGNPAPRPMTANFNRYYLLREVMRHTTHQWALWIDADAIVADPSVSVEPIINADRDKLIIACRGTDAGEHDINNGVFFFNLRHRDAARFLGYVIVAVRHVRPDNSRFRSDQRHMQSWLRRRMRPDGSIPQLKRYAGRHANDFNYNGPFIKHFLRRAGSFDQRIERLKSVQRDAEAKLLAAEQSDLSANYND